MPRKEKRTPGFEAVDAQMEDVEPKLAGKLALVTGASRDIGESILFWLAKYGARVVCNYREKTERALGVVEKIHAIDGQVDLAMADITNVEQRQLLFETVSALVSPARLDILVLNASGKTTEINVTAANALIDLFIEIMAPGSTIVLMQSVPGHFFNQLENSEFLVDFYADIAAAKYAGEASLRARMYEFEKRGIKFIVVCPPIVPDTSNMLLFKRKRSNIVEMHEQISAQLHLPNIVQKDAVGRKVADLAASAGEYPQGYTEFFREEMN